MAKPVGRATDACAFWRARLRNPSLNLANLASCFFATDAAICTSLPSSKHFRMKTNLTFLGMLLALLLTQACSESKFDYRHKYVGDFEVTEWMYVGGIEYQPDTFALKNACNVDFAEDRHGLQLVIPTLEFSYTVLIDKQGKFQPFGETAGIMKFDGGYTDSDHFDFDLKWSSVGVSGPEVEYVMHGARR